MLTLLIFARAPVAGQCKTRLIPRLGARGAAWVQRRLVEHLVAESLRLQRGSAGAVRVEICCAPDSRHPFFSRLRAQHGLALSRQRRGDLGQRMVAAIRQRCGDGPVLLMGSDAFGLRAEQLQLAAEALQNQDYTLIAAGDGGYVLIGARQALPRLDGIDWSSGRERQQTLRRLRERGSVVADQPPRGDFDTVSDWRRARRQNLLPPLVRAGSKPPV